MTARTALILLFVAHAHQSAAIERHVAPGASGNGSASAPYGRIQDALLAAQPGDVVVIAGGTYRERLRSVRSGTRDAAVTIRARDGRGSVTVTAPGRVLTVNHAYLAVEGIVLDGAFGADDIVRVEAGGTGFTLRQSEVRRTSRDAVDIGAVEGVLIESSLIHHALDATEGRRDAHGIVAGAARRLTIRKTDIHTFSGDAFQIDPGRALPAWDDVLIEGCRFYLAPLPAAVNGFAAGTIPGENAVDTKVGPGSRPRLVIRDTIAHGFRGGLIRNMAAFNIKEAVDATIDGVTVHTSEIAFRLRSPARVRLQNAVIHDVAVGVRYEDAIEMVQVLNTTFGSGVGRAFAAASSATTRLDVRNVAVLGDGLPPQAAGPSNLALPASSFADVTKHDYRLSPGSAASDRGITLSEVTTDRDGTPRPQGAAYDIGAFERVAGVKRRTPSTQAHGRDDRTTPSTPGG